MSVADNLRAIAQEAEPRIEQWLDAADALADIRDAAKEKGIDWSALKALLVARARDNKDGGDRFETMTKKLDVRLGYADMLTIPPIVAEQSKTSATISKFPSAPVTHTSRTPDRATEAEAESQEPPRPVGASATDSASFESAASETAARSPDLSSGERTDEALAGKHAANVGARGAATATMTARTTEPVKVRVGSERSSLARNQIGEGREATNATAPLAPLAAAAGDRGDGGTAAALDDPYNADIRTTIFDRTGAFS